MARRGPTPPQGSYAILLRRITATIILAITLTLSAVACTPAQVTAFFDARGQSIDQPTAVTVAQALTRWDNEQRALLAYLAAVDANRSCSGPHDCAGLVQRAFDHMGVGWRGGEAVRVMMCESGGNPRATNGSHDGLFQQADAYWSGRSAQYGQAGRLAFDPWANAIVSAGMVRDTGGWSHWSCKP